jgi:hypothetical protein
MAWIASLGKIHPNRLHHLDKAYQAYPRLFLLSQITRRDRPTPEPYQHLRFHWLISPPNPPTLGGIELSSPQIWGQGGRVRKSCLLGRVWQVIASSADMSSIM